MILKSERSEPSAAANSGIELSVVVPLHNEALNVDLLFERLLPVLRKLALSHEIICVNDGSVDSTIDKLANQRERCPDTPIRIISLSRNFGKDIALSAGIDHAHGAAVIPIDSDLQDPPELIEQMVAKWREGFEVVYATRSTRHSDTWMKRVTAGLFYKIFDRLTEVRIPKDAGDFRLLDRRVVDALMRLPERTRFMKGLYSWVGFKQTEVRFEREPRNAGKTNWSYWRLWNFAIDATASFSSLPLKVWSYLGLIISLFAFVYAAFLAILELTQGNIPGYTSLMVVILFIGGVQLISLGVIGEYLARIYSEVKGRPLYVVRERIGFEDP